MRKRQKPTLKAVTAAANDRALTMAEEAADAARVRFLEEYHWAANFCGSPIEELLLAALMGEAQVAANVDTIFMGNHAVNDRHAQQEKVYIHQQSEVGPYRADFLIHDCSVPFEVAKPRLMAIECDGHEFHEKTKQQAQHDKRRDRYFQSLGIKLLRFTGSEIWADPVKCAEEIYNELQSEDGWRQSRK